MYRPKNYICFLIDAILFISSGLSYGIRVPFVSWRWRHVAPRVSACSCSLHVQYFFTLIVIATLSRSKQFNTLCGTDMWKALECHTDTHQWECWPADALTFSLSGMLGLGCSYCSASGNSLIPHLVKVEISLFRFYFSFSVCLSCVHFFNAVHMSVSFKWLIFHMLLIVKLTYCCKVVITVCTSHHVMYECVFSVI
jgi:hypothetical protein